jgi:hypothetical protein
MCSAGVNESTSPSGLSMCLAPLHTTTEFTKLGPIKVLPMLILQHVCMKSACMLGAVVNSIAQRCISISSKHICP